MTRYVVTVFILLWQLWFRFLVGVGGLQRVVFARFEALLLTFVTLPVLNEQWVGHFFACYVEVYLGGVSHPRLLHELWHVAVLRRVLR